jgi:Heterokaryon incompatibility protein (HET)
MDFIPSTSTSSASNRAHSCHHSQKLVIDLRRKTRAKAVRLNVLPNTISNLWKRERNPVVLDITLSQVVKAVVDGCAFFSYHVSGPFLDICDMPLNEKILLGLRDVGGFENVVLYCSVIGGECFHWRSSIFDLYASDGKTTSVSILDALRLGKSSNTEDSSSSYVKRRLSNLDPASESAFAPARQWLRVCDSASNPIGCRNTDKVPMPTRLIQIQAGDHPRVPRICLMSPERHVEYAALSYCWGGDQAWKTTEANMQAAHSSIEFSTFPRTIQDAVHVTQGIGLQNLWVDSLCIIQDNEDDVIHEIAKMSDIFTGAYVTIVAASAASSCHGFLQPRTLPGRENGFRFPCRLPNGSHGEGFLAPGVEAPHDPILSRAWVLQETVLSPRLLYCSFRQLQWFCR